MGDAVQVVVSAESDRVMLEKHGQDILIVLHAARKDELEKKIEAAGEAYKKTQEIVEGANKEVSEALNRQAEKFYAKVIRKFEAGLEDLPGCKTKVYARGELVHDKGVRMHLIIGDGNCGCCKVSDVGAEADNLVVKALKNAKEAEELQKKAAEEYVKLQKEMQRLPREREQNEARIAKQRILNSPEATALMQKVEEMSSRKLLA